MPDNEAIVFILGINVAILLQGFAQNTFSKNLIKPAITLWDIHDTYFRKENTIGADTAIISDFYFQCPIGQ